MDSFKNCKKKLEALKIERDALTAELARYREGVEVEGVIDEWTVYRVCFLKTNSLPDGKFEDGERVRVIITKL